MAQHRITTILSTCVVDDEVKPAEILCADRLESDQYQSIEELTSSIEEADDRIVVHCAWQVEKGGTRLLVITNDSDTVMRRLCFFHPMEQMGLKELWVEFGVAERRRHLPVHHLAHTLGERLCRIVMKAYVLTGDDALSKVGTKYAATVCEPVRYLGDFAESDEFSADVMTKTEEYLVRVWAGAKSSPDALTFDELRFKMYTRSASAKPLSSLPATSSVMHGHISRAFCVVGNILQLLEIKNPPVWIPMTLAGV